MLFKVAFLSALLAATSASASASASASVSADVSSASVQGKNLISKSRRVNQEYEEDFSWLVNYSIKFDSCHSIHSYRGGEGGGGGEDGANSSPFGTTHLVKYRLCPTSSCSRSCSGGGEYVVELRDFVETYTQAKEEISEAACQAVEENCNCNYYDGDDQACMNQCYATAGLTDCGDDENNNNNNNNNNGEDFDIEEYMECKEAEFYYNGANGNTPYYIGPVCSNNGKSIHLNVFTDSSCTTAAPSGTYKKYNYYDLPYSPSSRSSIVGNDCLSCKDAENENDNDNENNNNNNNNNGNYYEAPEPAEFCTEFYEDSAKCETNLKYKTAAYRDTGSCQYINTIIPSLERVYHSRIGGGGGAATGFAVFFGLTTVAATAASYYFFKKVERSTVDLSAQSGDATFA